MNPVTIFSGVLSCVHAIFDAIDKAQQGDAAEHDALKALKRTVVDVEVDIKFFETMFSALESSEYENTRHFLERSAISCCPPSWKVLLIFYSRHDTKQAMKKFQEALSAMTIVLGTESAKKSSTLPNTNNSLKSLLQSIMHLPPARQRTVFSELREARINILDNQQNIKRDFRHLWNLYIIFQQQENVGTTFSLNRCSAKSMTGALDAVSWDFINHPFGISRSCGSFSLSVLNRDHDTASKKEELAKKLGKQWIDDRVNRHHVPANELIDVQIPLFELIWSGTMQQLRGNPTYSTNDPEHREFEQILNQLDSSLQEVIARSKRPRFTISFCGMVKAGKSLFLNALIGNIVLPSNGRYPCNSSI